MSTRCGTAIAVSRQHVVANGAFLATHHNLSIHVVSISIHCCDLFKELVKFLISNGRYLLFIQIKKKHFNFFIKNEGIKYSSPLPFIIPHTVYFLILFSGRHKFGFIEYTLSYRGETYVVKFCLIFLFGRCNIIPNFIHIYALFFPNNIGKPIILIIQQILIHITDENNPNALTP